MSKNVQNGGKISPNLVTLTMTPISLFSRFSVPEMKRIYRGFKTECPTGLITEEAFHGIYARFFPNGGEDLRQLDGDEGNGWEQCDQIGPY